ncbi:hypothetical protein [Azospirillum sp. B2RO_4]|uniref:hypothetical protein n=1 Tax=Azospirillum sp. B2RO_4 TaxID=3027796 RepID=UPI003DA7EB70
MKHARADYDRIQDTAGIIPADEPVFLIRGQDAVGAAAVRAWADLAEAAGAKPDILFVTRAHADRMEAWAIKKTPDLPAAPVSASPQALAASYRVGFMIPEGLHPNTATLVRDFAEAMAKKLRAFEVKHGWTANWMRPDWRGELAAELLRHVHKGDPIDVAAYAAFAWFHGWSVTPAEASATSGGHGASPRLAEEIAREMANEMVRARNTLNNFVRESADPGADAMASLWCMGQLLAKAHAAGLLPDNPTATPAYDPLRRIDYPEGRFGPAMLDGDDEMTSKELKLIAKSHGFDLRLKVEEWDDGLRDMVIDDTFGAALEAACPPQVDKDGYQLVGAWDSEDGDLVLAYVRPLVADAKSEGSANG